VLHQSWQLSLPPPPPSADGLKARQLHSPGQLQHHAHPPRATDPLPHTPALTSMPASFIAPASCSIMLTSINSRMRLPHRVPADDGVHRQGCRCQSHLACVRASYNLWLPVPIQVGDVLLLSANAGTRTCRQRLLVTTPRHRVIYQLFIVLFIILHCIVRLTKDEGYLRSMDSLDGLHAAAGHRR
jgi:hypothetical protein